MHFSHGSPFDDTTVTPAVRDAECRQYESGTAD